MNGAAPDIAGGHVLGQSLSNGDLAQEVFGCKCLKFTGGTYTVTMANLIKDPNRVRVWVQNMSAIIPWCAVVTSPTPMGFNIQLYRIVTDLTDPENPVTALQAADFAFAFGVSIVPV